MKEGRGGERGGGGGGWMKREGFFNYLRGEVGGWGSRRREDLKRCSPFF